VFSENTDVRQGRDEYKEQDAPYIHDDNTRYFSAEHIKDIKPEYREE
jgi:hypothetical protein